VVERLGKREKSVLNAPKRILAPLGSPLAARRERLDAKTDSLGHDERGVDG